MDGTKLGIGWWYLLMRKTQEGAGLDGKSEVCFEDSKLEMPIRHSGGKDK